MPPGYTMRIQLTRLVVLRSVLLSVVSRPALGALGAVLALAVGGGAPAASAAPVLSAEKAAQSITAAWLRPPARALADDKLAGRQPGTPGETETQRYLSEQLQSAGLVAAGDGKSYVQALNLTGLRSRLVGTPNFRSQSTSIPVQIAVGPAELALQATEATPTSAVRESEMVFVGYGITAPEFQWDDYKGLDVHGKVVLLLDSDPQQSPTLFAGKSRLHYGRWPFKLAEAARRGAVAALVVHDPATAGEPFAALAAQWMGEHYLDPAAKSDQPRLTLRGFITADACRRIMQAGGQDFDALRRAAEDRAFNPNLLPVKMSAQLQNQPRKLTTGNVVAMIPGSDARLRSEAVVITAHADGMGTRPEEPGPDKIWNGGRDNAVGLAMLLGMARAAKLGPPPKRTLVFAALTAQSSGFQGARYLLAHLPQPVTRAIAHLNLDLPATGASRPQVIQIGRGKSSLDALFDAVAKLRKRQVLADPSPQLGLYYRSDSLPFAEQGIPSLFLGAPDTERFLGERFLRPSDALDDDLKLDTTAEDAQLLYLTALRIAASTAPPKWSAGDEFAPKP